MRVFVLPREEAMREMSLGRGLAILTVNIARVFVKKGGAVPKDMLAVCCCQINKVLVPRFLATRCSPRTVKFGPTSC